MGISESRAVTFLNRPKPYWVQLWKFDTFEFYIVYLTTDNAFLKQCESFMKFEYTYIIYAG